MANIYLDALDHLMAERGLEMVRYADDFVVLCRSGEEAEVALTLVRNWVKDAGLTLHPEKTRLTTESQGFEFLGYLFKAGERWPRKKSLAKLKDSIRQKTRRTNGKSLQAIIVDMNLTLHGWFEYYKHSHKWTFERLDRWLRKRLRSILRKRSGRRGPGRGLDHHRWPNAFFSEQGLLSLQAAHASGCQSSRR